MFFGITGISQTYNVSLQVKDAETKLSIEFCNVIVFDKTDSVIISAYTNDDGFVEIPLKKGRYKIILSMMGYENDTLTNIFVRGEKFLDVYKLQPLAQDIETVTVTGSPRTVEIDKDVQLVTGTMKEGAANTYEVLDKVGGLHYDRYNNNITVDNNDNIIILVNGIEKNQDYVRNLNPERLLKVEVIRDPGGKYGLKGYAAVINIILKSNYKGTDINVSSFGIYTPFNSSIPLVAFNYSNASINYTNKKINFYINYSPFVNNFHLHAGKEQIYNDSSEIIYSNPENELQNLIVNNLYQKASIGIDYYLSPKNTLSLEANLIYMPSDFGTTQIDYVVTKINDSITPTPFNMNSLSKNSIRNAIGKVFYIGNYNTSNSLNVTYAYSLNQSQNYNEVNYGSVQTIENVTNQNNYSDLNVEYNHTFNDKLGILIGYGNTFSNYKNKYKNDISASDSIFSYNQIKNEIYSYISYKIGRKISIKGGIGYENGIIQNSDITRSFNIYEPYVDIKYTPISMLDIKLKYRSDGKYPSVDQINPFTTVVDWQTISKGNPDLEPERSNKISFSVSAMQGLFRIEPYYEFSNNTIINVMNQQTNGLWLMTYENAAQKRERGISANLTAPIKKKFFITTGTKIYHQEITYLSETRSLNDWTLVAQFFYRNPKSKTLVGTFMQKQMQNQLVWTGYHTYGSDLWGLLFQQPLFKDKLNIMVIYALPVNLWMEYNQGGYAVTSKYQEFNTYDISIIKNAIMFQISYRFSKGREVRKINKNDDLEIENQPKRIF